MSRNPPNPPKPQLNPANQKKSIEELYDFYENQRLRPNDSIEIDDDDDDDDDDAWHYITYIAGVNHHCDDSDIGGFIGLAKPQPENPYDKNAIAIIRNDGALLGYIPAKELGEYRAMSNAETFHCVGYIVEGNNGLLNGRVKVILSRDDVEVNHEVAAYVRWLLRNKGKRYLPNGFDFHTTPKPRTKTEMIDAINDYLAE